MKTRPWFCLVISTAMACSARAQGTLVFDQQSSTSESITGGWLSIQANQPFGQSFVPTLSSIGFVRLRIDQSGAPVQGQTVYVNLLSDSITGPVLASTLPVAFPDYFNGYITFNFSTGVSLSPGTRYYLQPVASTPSFQAGVIGGNPYPNGSVFLSGVEHVGEALWFREGIVVPEPATVSLTLVAGSLLLWLRQKASMR